MELATAEEKEKQRRLGGVVAEFVAADYFMRPSTAAAAAAAAAGTTETTAEAVAGSLEEGVDREEGGGMPLLRDFTYSFRQRDRIGIVGPNG